MGILSRLKAGVRAFSASADISTLSDAPIWLEQALIGRPTASGKLVGPETALRASAVLACVRILCEDIATLPLRVYVRTRSGSQYAISHPLFELLYDSPNDEMTAVELREHMVLDMLLTGGFYILIDYNGSGDDLTGEICTRWNERESTWRKSGSCQSRGTSQSRS